MGGEGRGLTPSFLSAWPWAGTAGPLLIRATHVSYSHDSFSFPSQLLPGSMPTLVAAAVFGSTCVFSPVSPSSTVLTFHMAAWFAEDAFLQMCSFP